MSSQDDASQPKQEVVPVFAAQYVKPSAKESVPIWHTSTDSALNQSLLETFIFDLKEVKKLSLFENDQRLIFLEQNANSKF